MLVTQNGLSANLFFGKNKKRTRKKSAQQSQEYLNTNKTRTNGTAIVNNLHISTPPTKYNVQSNSDSFQKKLPESQKSTYNKLYQSDSVYIKNFPKNLEALNLRELSSLKQKLQQEVAELEKEFNSDKKS